MEIAYLYGLWTYQSWNNDGNLATALNNIAFGSGYIRVDTSAETEFKGRVYGPASYTDPTPCRPQHSWQFKFNGSANYSASFIVHLQGKRVNGGNEWIYDYVGYLVPSWQNGID